MSIMCNDGFKDASEVREFDESADSRGEPLTYLDIIESMPIDTTGIPVCSDREVPDVGAEIDWRYGPCPYKTSPSRYPNGKPHETPMSYLERDRLVQYWRPMLAVVSGIRQTYIESLQGTINHADALSSQSTLILLNALKCLPYYLIHRHPNGIAPDSLPPSSLVLANSASGTLGTLSVYIGNRTDLDSSSPNDTPEPSELIKLAESDNGMIGKKTVCVASPKMMEDFMNAAIKGKTPATDLEHVEKDGLFEVFAASEVPALVDYAKAVLGCTASMDTLGLVDEKAYAVLNFHIQRGHSPRRLREAVEDWLKDCNTAMVGFVAHQIQLNASLGRQAAVPPISVNNFETICKLRVPSLVSKFKPVQLPRSLSEGVVRRVHVGVDLAS